MALWLSGIIDHRRFRMRIPDGSRALLLLLGMGGLAVPRPGFAQSKQTIAQVELQEAERLGRAGQYPEAIAAYKTYLRKHPRSEIAALGLAENYRRVHNIDEARSVLQATRTQHPQSVQVLKALGNLELEAQSYDAALDAFQAAKQIAPNDLQLHIYLGTAYKGKNDSDAALTEFNGVLVKDPGNPLAHFLRAELHSDAGENEKALADVEKVVQARPGYLPGQVLLAKVLVRLNRCRPAVEALEPAHENKQLTAESLFILANAYQCSGNSEKAKQVREEFTVAAQVEHQHNEDDVQSKHLVEQANEAAQKNNFPEALRLLDQALQQNPQNGFAYSQRAKILFSRGDVSGADKEIDRALAIQPFQPDFLYVKGVIQERQGELEGAIGSFTRVTEINPKEADAFYEIGTIRLRQGDTTKARAAFRKAVELDPEDSEYKRALEAVQSSQP